MQINNNDLRASKSSLPAATMERIIHVKELFKTARTMKEKEALANMLAYSLQLNPSQGEKAAAPL